MATIQQVPALERALATELVASFANHYKIDRHSLYETMVNTVFPRKDGKIIATPEMFVMCISVAEQYKLNPFTRQIYFMASKGGGVVPIVPIDGWVELVNRVGDLDGLRWVPVFEIGKDAKGREIKYITEMTCKMKRRGMAEWIEVTEYFVECDRQTDQWTNMPVRMLRHKAYIQCARVAYGLSGIYDPDEAADIVKGETDQSEGESASEAILMPRREVKSGVSEAKPVERETIHVLPSKVGADNEIDALMQAFDNAPEMVSAQKPAAKKPLQSLAEMEELAKGFDLTDLPVAGGLPAGGAKAEPGKEQRTIPADWAKPAKALEPEYVKIGETQRKKLFATIRAAKAAGFAEAETVVRRFIWEEWGLESTKDIPLVEFNKVITHAGGNVLKFT